MKLLSKVISFFKKEEISPKKELIKETIKVNTEQDWPSVFARCFSTSDGKQVAGYLRYFTLEKSLGADVSDDLLRYQEGRRSIVTQILSLIAQGQDNKKS